MTKTFDKESIIKIDGGYVVVDKETKPTLGEYAYIKFTESPKDNDVYKITKTTLDEGDKVIASIGIHIEGVPLIELPDENDFNLSKLTQELSYQGVSIVEINAFKNGYKANQKQYTEADMISAFKMKDKGIPLYEILNRLQTKVPISVTLKYEDNQCDGCKANYQLINIEYDKY